MIILGALLGLMLGLILGALLRLAIPGLFPPQGGFHSHYYIGVLPSNPDGTFARRDYWLMAGLSLAGAVACLLFLAATTWTLGTVSPSRPHMEQMAGGVTFALGLLTALCLASAMLQIGRAIRWRPRRLACDWWPEGEESL